MRAATTVQRLLVILLAIASFIWLLLGVLSYQGIRAELRQLMDSHLVHAAQLIMLSTHHEVQEADIRGFQTHLDHHPYAQSLLFQVWSLDGRRIFRSKDAPLEMLTQSAAGYQDMEYGGEAWRVLVLRRQDMPYRVIVAARRQDRDLILDHVTYRATTPLIWLFLPLVILVWLGVNQGLAPLARVTEHIRQRRPDDLEPVTVADLPRDLLPLVDSLNSLLQRLRAAYQRHERVASDVAHELRTPLAGTRTLVESARTMTDSRECRDALDGALGGVDQAIHRVEQILTLARLEPDQLHFEFGPVDLPHLLQAELADRVPHALSRNVHLELEAPIGATVSGVAGLLRLLAGNLVENAVRHSPPGERVVVSVAMEAGRPAFRVTDAGPGIPESEIKRVFEPFYRGSGNTSEGAGLGLSIVWRIAEVHGADVALEAPDVGKGIVARVTFPPAHE